MNVTMSRKGLVWSLLILGILPRVLPGSCKIPNQTECISAFQMVRLKIETISAELQLQRAKVFKISESRSTNLSPVQEDWF